MIDKIKDIGKLFQEKKYSELIYLIETSFQKVPNEILNILAIYCITCDEPVPI